MIRHVAGVAEVEAAIAQPIVRQSEHVGRRRRRIQTDDAVNPRR